MKAKLTFSEPTCRYNCPYFKTNGNPLDNICYCMKAGGKNGKRFSRKDPKRRPPEWCPRRIHPVCRVYGFADDHSRMLEYAIRDWPELSTLGYISASEWRYRLRLELPLGMTAKEFYLAARRDGLSAALGGIKVETGEIIEIDNGLKPYAFYCLPGSRPAQVFSFDRAKTAPSGSKQKEEHDA